MQIQTRIKGTLNNFVGLGVSLGLLSLAKHLELGFR